jgi:hypothetical protein
MKKYFLILALFCTVGVGLSQAAVACQYCGCGFEDFDKCAKMCKPKGPAPKDIMLCTTTCQNPKK